MGKRFLDARNRHGTKALMQRTLPMPRTLSAVFAIAVTLPVLSGCAVPNSWSHSLAAPEHVNAALLELARTPEHSQVAVASVRSVRSAGTVPDHRRADFSAKDCKRIANANADLPEAWREGADFVLKVGDEEVPHRLMTTAVMPGENLTLDVVEARRQASFAADADGGTLVPRRPGTWTWKAPRQPGLYALRIVDRNGGDAICVNAFVKRPYNGGRDINGYRVGGYPRQPLNGDRAYTAPRGFIEVNAGVRDLWVSPNFRLEQFLCKQSKSNPDYLLLSPRLLLQLEYLLARAQERGIRASTFQILSAFRTPWYNAKTGNETRYSRHAYGDAADIYVDENGDGRMDDLDGDGRVTPRDADVLYELVEDSLHDEEFRAVQGGLGLYAHTRHAGPFVHVDARGTPIRWGKRIPQRSTPAHMTQRASGRDRSRF